MKHWGESFSQGVRIFRVVDYDGREQRLSLRASPGAGWSATHLESSGESTDVKLGRRELRIGRDPSCDVVLRDPSVAPQHCRISEEGGELVVRDRGFGVRINGQRCYEPTRIVDGARIEIGSSMIELLRGRSQLDPAKVSRHIRHRAASWSKSDEEGWRASYEELRREALYWSERGRPRGRLLVAERVDQAIELEGHIDFDELVDEFLTASVRRCRRRQTIVSVMAGAVPGLLLAVWVLGPALSGDAAAYEEEAGDLGSDAGTGAAFVPSPELALPVGSCEERFHKVIEIDTVESLARDYGVAKSDIRRDNVLESDGSLELGSMVRLCTTVGQIKRAKTTYTVRIGDTWPLIGARYNESPAFLREQAGVDILVPGEALDFWARRRKTTRNSVDVPTVEVPNTAVAEGAPNTGTLVDGLLLEGGGVFDVRCLMNAYISSFTYKSLFKALSRMRIEHGYDGQLVVGDISREGGGGYGRHLSHQTGRDVDLWLPIKGGVYRTGPKCGACGTPWCRPDPGEVDWEAAWRLIESLRAGDTVQQIFLDKSLMGALIDGAVETGADRSAVKMIVRPHRALVIHAAYHRHHIHVRFHCGPDEEKCVERAMRKKSGG